MAQLLTLTNAFVAVIPAAALFFWAYGRYDGTFRDNVVFLYFIGGLILGGFLGFMSLLSFVALAPLLAVLLVALMVPAGMSAVLNRRKWQGERHAVFNGGAFGLGVAVMMSLTFLYKLYAELSFTVVAQSIVVAIGFAGLLFGLGLLIGNSIRLRQPFRFSFLATAIILVPTVFLAEIDSEVGSGDRAWLFPALFAAFGLVVGFAAERRLLIEGVTEEDRKVRRRLARRAG